MLLYFFQPQWPTLMSMKVIGICLILCQLVLLFNELSYSQLNGKAVYTTLLEAEDYKKMDGFLFFNSNKHSVFYTAANQNSLESKRDSVSSPVSESSREIQAGFHFEPPDDSLNYYVHIDRNKQLITSRRNIFKDGNYQKCIVLEPMDIFQWSLIDESKNIMSYTAYRAETTFRGRSYTAWYTPEIPLNAGPWKFNGLPGLILEIADSEKGVQFLISSLNIPHETETHIDPPSEELVFTYQEYIELNDPERITDEILKLVTDQFPEGLIISSQPTVSVKKNMKGIERMF